MLGITLWNMLFSNIRIELSFTVGTFLSVVILRGQVHKVITTSSSSSHSIPELLRLLSPFGGLLFSSSFALCCTHFLAFLWYCRQFQSDFAGGNITLRYLVIRKVDSSLRVSLMLHISLVILFSLFRLLIYLKDFFELGRTCKPELQLLLRIRLLILILVQV